LINTFFPAKKSFVNETGKTPFFQKKNAGKENEAG
jgi:hypothetical protein